MSNLKILLDLLVVALTVIFFSRLGASKLTESFEVVTCHLLGEKFSSSHPWTNYPIVYEPINRGRLTIWTGQSNLPASEFKCSPMKSNATDTSGGIVLNFSGFANKLDWTFYDMNKGIIHNGVTVNHIKDVNYQVILKNNQAYSYTRCNLVEKITRSPTEGGREPQIFTTCLDCTKSLVSLIDAQMRELFKTKLEENLIDNLYWQLTQLLSNQHFSGPVSIRDDLD